MGRETLPPHVLRTTVQDVVPDHGKTARPVVEYFSVGTGGKMRFRKREPVPEAAGPFRTSGEGTVKVSGPEYALPSRRLRRAQGKSLTTEGIRKRGKSGGQHVEESFISRVLQPQAHPGSPVVVLRDPVVKAEAVGPLSHKPCRQMGQRLGTGSPDGGLHQLVIILFRQFKSF